MNKSFIRGFVLFEILISLAIFLVFISTLIDTNNALLKLEVRSKHLNIAIGLSEYQLNKSSNDFIQCQRNIRKDGNFSNIGIENYWWTFNSDKIRKFRKHQNGAKGTNSEPQKSPTILLLEAALSKILHKKILKVRTKVFWKNNLVKNNVELQTYIRVV
jgi:hypothetical protein